MASTFIYLPPSGGVSSLNGLTGNLTLVAGAGISVTPAGSNITIAATGGTGTVTSVAALVTNPLSGLSLTGSPITTSGTLSLTLAKSSSTTNGYLSSNDWNIFNNKLSASTFNYITNPDAEVDTSGWNLYNNAGRTVAASVVAQDITWTAVSAGNAGNDINISYIFHPTQSYLTPLVTVVSSTSITVAWYNGPTLANNPTATQLKAAFDAVPGAVALATGVITGTAGNRQYENGSNILANGGDTAPIDGTGGVVVGETLTRNTATPLIGVASFDLAKDAANRQGEGVSTDFVIDPAFQGQALQISFFYQASAAFVLSTSSDIRLFIYDITNAVMRPLTVNYLKGPTANTTYSVAAQFTASSNSVFYRLILHTATTNASAWDLIFDEVVATSSLDPAQVTATQSLVLPGQTITGAVNNTNGPMVVQWTDGAQAWAPAVNTGKDPSTMFGFATNIIGLTADITVRGLLGGFSFGPFVGYNQYIDNTAGLISPLPAPFTDTYVTCGKSVNSTTLNVQFWSFYDLVGVKGGLLTNTGANAGGGDVVLAVGANGNVLVANSAVADGIQWAPAVVAGTGLTYTTSTRGLALSNLAGDVTGAPQTNTIAAATVTGKAITGFVSGAGVVTAADTILTAINKLNGNIALKANAASPALTGTVTSTGSMQFTAIGTGVQVKTGTNAKIGTAVLVAGTATVANTSVTANSRIFLTSNTDGGTPGWLRVSAKTAATSFVITSSSGTDTSTVAWYIVESIP